MAAALGAFGMWGTQPEIALSLMLAAGATAVNPKRWWAFPLVAAVVVLAGLAFDVMKLHTVIGAAAAAGAIAAWLLPESTDLLDSLHGALATAAGAAIGLWATVQVLPEALMPTLFGATVTAGVVGLVASQGLIPVALRFDRIEVPGIRAIRKALRPAYRPPVFKALDLYRHAGRKAPDRDTKRGLGEVGTWVFRLQITLQALDRELATINVDDVMRRIANCEGRNDTDDPFTQERRAATALHLRRLLEHREAIATERKRTEALVEYATAFLEEARAGLAVATELPGELAPDRLPEVLHRLRTHAAAGNARRKTVREIGRVTQITQQG